MRDCILTINGGSVTLKFAVFNFDASLARRITGKFERIGLPDAYATFTDTASGEQESTPVQAKDHASCLPLLIRFLEKHGVRSAIKAIGYRVVHGGTQYRQATMITDRVLQGLREIRQFAIKHMPIAISLIEECLRDLPGIPQIACFDTAFHADLPMVAKLLPLPRHYFAKGIQRYGFHGLSYMYLMQELRRVGGDAEADGRVILAHLGNGASLAAVQHGRSVDTTMSMTPAAGIVMSTRTGDLDPGLVALLAATEGMDAARFDRLVNNESGLLGLSETAGDVRDLLSREASDTRAAEALAVFCYQARKWVGALAAAMGGLDTLVFSGGIGENAAPIRERICSNLEFLGILLDPKRNNSHEPIISTSASRVTVRVIPTDEELLVAQQVRALLMARAPDA